MKKNISHYLSFANVLCDVVREEINKNYMTENIMLYNKSLDKKKELVTNIDMKIEKIIRLLITKHYPLHNIIGEEEEEKRTLSDFTWIIDPIDGTKAFASGIPVFGVIIALKYKKENILGMVDLPALKQRFWNYKKKSYCNGNVIKTRRCKDFSTAVVASTEPNMFIDYKKMDEKVFSKFNFMRWGTDVLGYMRCAEGYIDAIIERNIKIWDIAGIVPIIKSAGGYITTWDGKKVGYNDTVCASGDKKLHNMLLKYLQNMI